MNPNVRRWLEGLREHVITKASECRARTPAQVIQDTHRAAYEWIATHPVATTQEVQEVIAFQMEEGVAIMLSAFNDRETHSGAVRARESYCIGRRLAAANDPEGAVLQQSERRLIPFVMCYSAVAIAALQQGVGIRGGADSPSYLAWLEGAGGDQVERLAALFVDAANAKLEGQEHKVAVESLEAAKKSNCSAKAQARCAGCHISINELKPQECPNC